MGKGAETSTHTSCARRCCIRAISSTTEARKAELVLGVRRTSAVARAGSTRLATSRTRDAGASTSGALTVGRPAGVETGAVAAGRAGAIGAASVESLEPVDGAVAPFWSGSVEGEPAWSPGWVSAVGSVDDVGAGSLDVGAETVSVSGAGGR